MNIGHTENPRVLPSTYAGRVSTAHNSSSRGSAVLCSPQVPINMLHRHTPHTDILSFVCLSPLPPLTYTHRKTQRKKYFFSFQMLREKKG